MKNKINYKIALLFVMLSASFSSAQTISGVFSSVGGKQTNSTHYLSFTMGESLIGFSNNSSTKSYAGFWYTYNESITTNVEDQFTVPTEYKLEQNYPNPFNPSTVIKFAVPERSAVTLKVYDIIGREVTTLLNEEKESGWYEYSFNASDLASGIYMYRLSTDAKVFTKKMMLIK